MKSYLYNDYINPTLKNIEIESLTDFKAGMYIHSKDVGSEYLIDVMIEKNIIGIDSEKAKERVPETVVFLIIIVQGYPDVAPKILTKSNFCSPSLMDGRDLLKDICPNWGSKSGLKPILEGMLPFLSRVINARGYKFYGTFHLGSTYNLKNFDNMIVGKLLYIFYFLFFYFSNFGLYCGRK